MEKTETNRWDRVEDKQREENEFRREKEKKDLNENEGKKIERTRESSVMDRHVPLISVELNRSLVFSFSRFRSYFLSFPRCLVGKKFYIGQWNHGVNLQQR